MTAKATAQRDTSAALRHAVYADLLSMLPIASYRQAQRFAANLALCRNSYPAFTADYRLRNRAIFRVMQRLVLLRVTPDLAEVKRPTPDRREIETALADKYGDRLKQIAGFYQVQKPDREEGLNAQVTDVRASAIRLNLPEGCALYGYRSREGFYTGVLCQPLDQIDLFFLLSSSKFSGPKAMRLTDADRAFFERFKEPVEFPPEVEAFIRTIPPFDATGFRWTGRRFVEVKNG